jgi:hypothetical protein
MWRLRRAQALLDLFTRASQDQQWQTAESAARESLVIRSAELGAADPATLVCRYHLAVALHARGRWEESEKELREALERASDVESVRPLAATMRTLLASVLRLEGRLAEAEVEARAAMTSRSTVAGPKGLVPQDVLALVLGDLGRHREAADQLAANVAARTASTGAGHVLVLKGRSDRLQHLAFLGLHEEVVREADAVRVAALGVRGPHALLLELAAANALAMSLSLHGRFQEAEALLRPAVAGGQGEDRFVLVLQLGLARALVGLGRGEEALVVVESSQAIFDQREGAVAHDQSAIMFARAAALLASDRPADAEREARGCLILCSQVLGPSHHRVLEAETLLGMAMARQGRGDQAAPQLQSAHAAWLAHFGQHHHGTERARRALAEAAA